jgi:hypothetical protein
MTELLGNIMAQVLSILALSTKAMKERRMSELMDSIFLSLAHCVTEKFLKRLMGRKDVEDALVRLDTLTKEEALMTATRNLEVIHHIDANVDQAKDGAKHPLTFFIHVSMFFFSLQTNQQSTN